MSVSQLHIDIKDHFQFFERVPFKAAWPRRDTRICFAWLFIFLIGLIWALVEIPGVTLTHSIPALLPIIFITLICAVHMGEVYSQIRAEHLGAGPVTSLSERLLLQQRWLCERYECAPGDLLVKAREMRCVWEERQEILRLASNDTMGPRFAAFFRLPDSARFMGLMAAIAAIIATVVTLGSNIDSFFEVMQDWRPIAATIFIATCFFAELILLWIMASGMVREIFPTILEQVGVWPLTSRRVYRYLLVMHTLSEPITPAGTKLPLFLKIVSLLFVPIPALYKITRTRLTALIQVGT